MKPSYDQRRSQSVCKGGARHATRAEGPWLLGMWKPLPLVKKILKILTSEGAFLDHFANLSEQKFLSKKRILFLIAYWYVHTYSGADCFFYWLVKIARAREFFFASLEIFCPHPLDFRLRGARKIYGGSKKIPGGQNKCPPF